MTELSFKLEVFEGPLDLLLELIRRHKLNIMDIEISVLLEQFLIYLERMTEADIEVTSDFLEMAARLILIKSSAILPKEESEKLKAELQGQLIELAMVKAMAAKLKTQYQGDTIFVREPAKIDFDPSYKRTHQPEEILIAFSAVAERSRRKAAYERPPAEPVVEKSYVSEFAGVMMILKSLRRNNVVELDALYAGRPRSQRVAVFLAARELAKGGRVLISEDGKKIQLKMDNQQ